MSTECSRNDELERQLELPLEQWDLALKDASTRRWTGWHGTLEAVLTR